MAVMDDVKKPQFWQRSETLKINDTGPFILVVGEVDYWRKSGRCLPVRSQMAFLNFTDVNADLLAVLRPDAIISPLLCISFDCLDLAQVLQAARYRGRYRVWAPGLPDPTVIKAEVQSLDPDLDFDVFSTQLPVDTLSH